MQVESVLHWFSQPTMHPAEAEGWGVGVAMHLLPQGRGRWHVIVGVHVLPVLH